MCSDNINSPEIRSDARRFVEITVLFLSFYVEITVPMRKICNNIRRIQLNPKVSTNKPVYMLPFAAEEM